MRLIFNKVILLLVCFLSTGNVLNGQEQKQPKRTQRQAHAHNDYKHPNPLHDAIYQGFCSVEADIFLVDDKLLVGHSLLELKPERTLKTLYLDPLRKVIKENGGRVHSAYPWFTLMIDIKSEGKSTYRELAKVLSQYQDILTSIENGKVTPRAVRVVISGNRPWDEIESEKIRYCGIDGRLSDLDSDKPAHLMPMISDNWGNHFQWRGEGSIPTEEKTKLIQIVKKAHRAGRAVRFWNTPEKKSVWEVLYQANVDFINTDQLENLSQFLAEKESAFGDAEISYYFISSQKLPDVIIDGKKAHIHTQGLYLSQKYIYVTGRLNEHPRRALFLRFLRSAPEHYEYIDITPDEKYTKRNKAVLDHPGGFDRDATHFWIPVSASKRDSITLMIKVPFEEEKPLKDAKPEIGFEVNDHIGALAFAGVDQVLYGANWDTLITYCWLTTGKETKKIPRNQLIKSDPDQHIAVQDWKTLNQRDLVMMGGLDKSPQRSPMVSKSLVEIVNMKTRERMLKARIYGPKPDSGNMTNEGFHFDHKFLYFLPDDLGSGASIYRYSLRKPQKK